MPIGMSVQGMIVSLFILEIPVLIALAYVLPALQRAGRPQSSRVAITCAAVLTPAIGYAAAFCADVVADAFGGAVSNRSLLAIAVLASSVYFTMALRIISKARSLLFAGCAATVVLFFVIAAVFTVGGTETSLAVALIIFGLPFWHFLLGAWTLGWSHAERHRLIEINPTCLHCGYDLRGLPTRTCPECGKGPGA